MRSRSEFSYLLSLLFSHHSQKFHGIRHIYHTVHDNLHLIPILCILLHQNLCHMQSAPYTSVPPSPKPILFSFSSYLFPPRFDFFQIYSMLSLTYPYKTRNYLNLFFILSYEPLFYPLTT